MERKHKNEYALYEMIDGILHIRFKVDTMDILAAEAIVDSRMLFQRDQDLPILCDVRSVRYVDPLAREYFAKEGSLFIKVLAFLVEPGINGLLGELYIEQYYPQGPKYPFPSKTFTLRVEALKFINEQLKGGGASPK